MHESAADPQPSGRGHRPPPQVHRRQALLYPLLLAHQGPGNPGQAPSFRPQGKGGLGVKTTGAAVTTWVWGAEPASVRALRRNPAVGKAGRGARVVSGPDGSPRPLKGLASPKRPSATALGSRCEAEPQPARGVSETAMECPLRMPPVTTSSVTEPKLKWLQIVTCCGIPTSQTLPPGESGILTADRIKVFRVTLS